jgi:hypothetical protein
MTESPRITWYRELPPLNLSPVGEEEVEARSTPVPIQHDEREAIWAASAAALKVEVERRILQHLETTGLEHAHVVSEHLEEYHDSSHGTFELRGRWSYIVFRTPDAPPQGSTT